MDFNTGRGSGGSSGRRDSSGPLFGNAGASPPRPSGPSASGTGGGFNLSDPVGSFLGTIKALVSSPIGFFRTLPPNGGFASPLAFAAICSIIAAVPIAVILVLLSLLAADVTVIVAALVSSLLILIALPVGTIISAFVNAGIYHLILYLLVRNSNAGFEATLRVLCYASFPVVLAFLFLIPLLNILVSLALSVYVVILFVLGMREMHRITTGQAAIVVLAPIAVTVVLGLVLGVLGALIGALAGSA